MIRPERMSSGSKMYLFSTENIRENYRLLPIRGKAVLVVCGSGDQVLDMLLHRPRKVITFDSNENARHSLDMKIAAVKSLDFHEFNSFLNSNSRDVLGYRLYLELRRNLPRASKGYFDRAYSENDMNGRAVYRTRFRSRFHRVDSNKYTSNPKDYAQLKRLVRRGTTEFVLSDVTSLHRNSALKAGKFDLIYLSNIPSYLRKPAYFKGGLIAFFNDVVLGNLSGLLKEDGMIAFCEVYSYFKNATGIPRLVTQKAIGKIGQLGDFEVEQSRVHGYYDKRRGDILVKLRPVGGRPIDSRVND